MKSINHKAILKNDLSMNHFLIGGTSIPFNTMNPYEFAKFFNDFDKLLPILEPQKTSIVMSSFQDKERMNLGAIHQRFLIGLILRLLARAADKKTDLTYGLDIIRKKIYTRTSKPNWQNNRNQQYFPRGSPLIWPMFLEEYRYLFNMINDSRISLEPLQMRSKKVDILLPKPEKIYPIVKLAVTEPLFFSLNVLPDEVKELIIKRIDLKTSLRLSKVCKDWKLAFNLKRFEKLYITPMLIDDLFTRKDVRIQAQPFTKSVFITGFDFAHFNHYHYLRSLLEGMKQLEHIEIEGSGWLDFKRFNNGIPPIQHVLQPLRDIKSLDLTNLELGNYIDQEEITLLFNEILDLFPKLDALFLPKQYSDFDGLEIAETITQLGARLDRISIMGFESLAIRLKEKHLHFTQLKLYLDDTLKEYGEIERDLEKFISKCKNLKKLTLENITYPLNMGLAISDTKLNELILKFNKEFYHSSYLNETIKGILITNELPKKLEIIGYQCKDIKLDSFNNELYELLIPTEELVLIKSRIQLDILERILRKKVSKLTLKIDSFSKIKLPIPMELPNQPFNNFIFNYLTNITLSLPFSYLKFFKDLLEFGINLEMIKIHFLIWNHFESAFYHRSPYHRTQKLMNKFFKILDEILQKPNNNNEKIKNNFIEKKNENQPIKLIKDNNIGSLKIHTLILGITQKHDINLPIKEDLLSFESFQLPFQIWMERFCLVLPLLHKAAFFLDGLHLGPETKEVAHYSKIRKQKFPNIQWLTLNEIWSYPNIEFWME